MILFCYLYHLSVLRYEFDCCSVGNTISFLDHATDVASYVSVDESDLCDL